MKFTDALSQLVAGEVDGIRHKEWEEDRYIAVQRPDEHSKMTAPYLYYVRHNPHAYLCPVHITNWDIFGAEWETVKASAK